MSAHDGELNEYNCHDATPETDEEQICHCHDSTRLNKPLACTEGKPDKPVISIYGLRIEPENECTDYQSTDYSYGPHLDRIWAAQQGGYYAAYEDFCYQHYRDVTIEHLVARKEAHVSGLCKADKQTRLAFANDLDNIALAVYEVNSRKSDKDVAEWLPDHHQCWFVAQVVHVKRKYDMSVDQKELDAIKEVLSNCEHEDTFLHIPSDCTLSAGPPGVTTEGQN